MSEEIVVFLGTGASVKLYCVLLLRVIDVNVFAYDAVDVATSMIWILRSDWKFGGCVISSGWTSVSGWCV